MKVTFWGASDDLVEVGGEAEGCDEYSYFQHYNFLVCKRDEVDDEESPVILIQAHYGKNGAWSFRPSLVEEEVDEYYEIPEGWEVTITHQPRSYSLHLNVDSGDDELFIIPIYKDDDIPAL